MRDYVLFQELFLAYVVRLCITNVLVTPSLRSASTFLCIYGRNGSYYYSQQFEFVQCIRYTYHFPTLSISVNVSILNLPIEEAAFWL